MEKKIKSMIASLELNEPATQNAIDEFQRVSGLKLPQDYVRFLMMSNGAEGIIGTKAYVMLWRLEELIELNEAYNVQEYAKGLFLFGSDGGGEAYAFDIRSQTISIVRVPFVGMDVNLAVRVADNFDQFIGRLYEE